MYISQFRIPSIALSLLTAPVLESVVHMKTGLQNGAFMFYLLRILIWHQQKEQLLRPEYFFDNVMSHDRTNDAEILPFLSFSTNDFPTMILLDILK